MAITQISKVQVRMGEYTNLPVLSPGQFGYATDTKQLFIGNTGGTLPTDNTEVLTKNSLQVHITADLLDRTNAVNTTGKVAGLMVFNTTNNLIYVAGGPTDVDNWYPSNGGAAITPV